MFAVCVESSHSRGMGHLFRMLHLAAYLKGRDIPFLFLVNEHLAALQKLRQEGVPFELAPADFNAAWSAQLIRSHGIRVWINDRLDTESAQPRSIKDAGVRLATFDDRGEGAAYADLHIAALSFNDAEPLGGRRVLRGLDYIILNPEIAKFRRHRNHANRWLVTLGGSDTYGVTVKIVRAMRELGMAATIVLGPAFAHHDDLHSCLTSDFAVKSNIPSLIAEMAEHDLAITGGGVTCIEAAASGLPVMCVANELFEVPIGLKIESLGAGRFVGYHERFEPLSLAKPMDVAAMSAAGIAGVPLSGTANVARALQEMLGA